MVIAGRTQGWATLLQPPGGLLGRRAAKDGQMGLVEPDHPRLALSVLLGQQVQPAIGGGGGGTVSTTQLVRRVGTNPVVHKLCCAQALLAVQ